MFFTVFLRKDEYFKKILDKVLENVKKMSYNKMNYYFYDTGGYFLEQL